MCTVMFVPETLEAERQSTEEARKSVDELMARERELAEARREYERIMAAPFSADELKELLKKKPKEPEKTYQPLLTDTEEQREAAARSKAGAASQIDNLINYRFRHDDDILSPRELGEQFEIRPGWSTAAHGWEDYRVLSDEEKKIVDDLGLTPPRKKCEPLTEEERKERLARFRRCSRIGSTVWYVMRYDCPRGEFAGRSFYYLVTGDGGYLSAVSELPEFAALKADLRTKSDDPAARWMLILKNHQVVAAKDKLRPYQISFLEARCAETEKAIPHPMENLSVLDRVEEDRRKLWDRFQLFTEEEKRLAGKLGLTPEKPKTPGKPRTFSDGLMICECETDAERRRKLKESLHERPSFGSYDEDGTGRVYVWLDNCCFGNSDKKGFYYVRFQLSMLSGGTTAYSHPALIVRKNKLRPDQVEYMECKCRETLEAAKQEAERYGI